MLLSEQSDGTLVMLTLAGEDGAYEALVSRWERAVIAAAKSVLRTAPLAEDAAQDAFITAWMKLDALHEPEKFGAWTCRIAKNLAKNMIVRYRSWLPLDAAEASLSEEYADPERLALSREEREELHESIAGLPERVREVIRLHYFEDVPVAEIAGRLGVTVGTVKAQLFDGRKRIRKELCAMNENMNDDLTARIMKKVNEIKLWQLKNNRTGFDALYRETLAEVETLPESKEKSHALADVLLRGWWWIEGEKNDAIFARLREAAEAGHNDEVMQVIAAREDDKYWGETKIAFIRDTQIPRLEAAGYPLALAHEWFWLGEEYFEENQPEKGFEALATAESVAPEGTLRRAMAAGAFAMHRREADEYKDASDRAYRITASAAEVRRIDGAWRRWDYHWNSCGGLLSADLEADHIFRNASVCDGYFTIPGAHIGDTHIGSDGTTLTYAARGVHITTPAGDFDDCDVWTVQRDSTLCTSYYRAGIGIVKQELRTDGITETRVLAAYEAGKRWEYAAAYPADVMAHRAVFTVDFAADGRCILRGDTELHRLRYDETSWLDMVQKIRGEYWQKVDGEYRVCDVSDAVERALTLAKTPAERAHAKAAGSVARRIMDTNEAFNPDFTATGHWNFFVRSVAAKKRGRITLSHSFRWSFELKNIGSTAEETLLYNDIYGILQDAAGCVWSDEWRIGAKKSVEYTLWGETPIKTEIVCTDAGRVTTAAGTFDGCMTLALDIRGMDDGFSYRGGKKEYTFAPGIGIVRAVHHDCAGAREVVYELTAYEGIGEGYFPMADGMLRRYEAPELTDGCVGAAEYVYVADGDDMLIFEDRTGIRRKPEKVTEYASIWGEVVEDMLWEQGKRDESRLRHDTNNVHLLTHFLGRPTRYWAKPEKAVAWNKYRMQTVELLGGGEVPPAWKGFYTMTCFRTACALFGVGKNDEGYEYLDRALAMSPDWLAIPDGEALERGDAQILGGAKLIKGDGVLLLADGTKEPLAYDWMFVHTAADMYRAMTAAHGWEWFNGVRGEERFKEAIARAQEIAQRK